MIIMSGDLKLGWIEILALIAQGSFLATKLLDVGLVADWEWVWVLAPTWIYITVYTTLSVLRRCFLAIARWRYKRAELREMMSDGD